MLQGLQIHIFYIKIKCIHQVQRFCKDCTTQMIVMIATIIIIKKWTTVTVAESWILRFCDKGMDCGITKVWVAEQHMVYMDVNRSCAPTLSNKDYITLGRIIMTDFIDHLGENVVGQLPHSRWHYNRVSVSCPRTPQHVARRNWDFNHWPWGSKTTALPALLPAWIICQ